MSVEYLKRINKIGDKKLSGKGFANVTKLNNFSKAAKRESNFAEQKLGTHSSKTQS